MPPESKNTQCSCPACDYEKADLNLCDGVVTIYCVKCGYHATVAGGTITDSTQEDYEDEH